MINFRKIIIFLVFTIILSFHYSVLAEQSSEDLYNYILNTYNKNIDDELIKTRLIELQNEYNTININNTQYDSFNNIKSYAESLQDSINYDIDNKISIINIEKKNIAFEIENSLLELSIKELSVYNNKYDNCNNEIDRLLSDKTSLLDLYNENYYEKIDTSYFEESIKEIKDILSYNKDNFNKEIGSVSKLKRPFNYTPGITSYCGYRRDPIDGTTKYHNAVDYSMPVGTELYALFNGTVVLSGNSGNGYGENIKIDCGNGLIVHYAHMSSRKVSVGDKVVQNQLIGYSGNTGRSTGPHLHLGLYYKEEVLDVERLFNK